MMALAAAVAEAPIEPSGDGEASRYAVLDMEGPGLNRRDFTVAAVTGMALPSAFAARATILVVGDSLSAEYGLTRGTGWVALLEKKLAAEKIDARVVNASISGDTTSGGRARLPGLLAQHKPTHVVIELGGNDALRGGALSATEENLSQMTQAAQKSGAKVLLVGMQVPPNYGTAYANQFAGLFPKVARRHDAALVPFLLTNVADVPQAAGFFQADRIHPRAEAQPLMLANVWPELRKLLR
jgi:acyl-CoA thioesterase-1